MGIQEGMVKLEMRVKEQEVGTTQIPTSNFGGKNSLISSLPMRELPLQSLSYFIYRVRSLVCGRILARSMLSILLFYRNRQK